ncbi:MAG TPA: hypothetical protein ENJ45_05560, partial [Phaeodactylibacter sp.]|nr:hypothetical protein [Phaeodactylibacter sp.]
MKRNLLIAVLALFCFQSFTAIAQKPHNLTNQHLNLLTRYYDLSIQDIAGAVLSHKHISRTSGVYHFYYNQSYQGIQIHQAVADIHILPDGKVLSHH